MILNKMWEMFLCQNKHEIPNFLALYYSFAYLYWTLSVPSPSRTWRVLFPMQYRVYRQRLKSYRKPVASDRAPIMLDEWMENW